MTGFFLFWEISAHDELWEVDTLLKWLAKKSAHQPTLVGSWIKTSVYFLVNASNGKYNRSLKKIVKIQICGWENSWKISQ